jgi:hypothetical protein
MISVQLCIDWWYMKLVPQYSVKLQAGFAVQIVLLQIVSLLGRFHISEEWMIPE